MTYMGKDFSPLVTTELEPFTFDFVESLASGEQLTDNPAPHFVLKGLRNADPDASTRLIGSPTINIDPDLQPPTGLMTCASQRVEGVLPVRYKITCTVTTTLGRRLTRWSFFQGEAS